MSKKLFCQNVFKNCKERIQWFESKGVLKVNPEVNATIQLHDSKIKDNFNGILVQIVNKKDGKIDSMFFKFDDYLKARVDNRQGDYTGSFEVISHCGWKWYIATPITEEVDAMVKEIIKYIKMWK